MGTVKVMITGDEVQALYNDKFNILPIADEVKIERASDVMFDNEKGVWRVIRCDTGEVLPETFKLRADAIAYEVKYLEQENHDAHS